MKRPAERGNRKHGSLTLRAPVNPGFPIPNPGLYP